MKRMIRITQVIIICLLLVFAGLTIFKATIVEAETDETITEVDEFIKETESAKLIPTEPAVGSIVNSVSSIKVSIPDYRIVDNTEIEVQDNLVIQEEVIEDLVVVETEEVYTEQPVQAYPEMSPEDFQNAGIIDWNGWRYTYYSEQVLPGGGLQIPGRWSDGQFVRDENGYLCVACNDLDQGTIVSTPFGDAIVYDWVGDDVHGLIDIYVSW